MSHSDTMAADEFAPLRTNRLQLDWSRTTYLRGIGSLAVLFAQVASSEQVDRLREWIVAIDPTSDVVGVWRVTTHGFLVDHLPIDADARALAEQLNSLVAQTNALEDGDGGHIDAESFVERHHNLREQIADQLAGRSPMPAASLPQTV